MKDAKTFDWDKAKLEIIQDLFEFQKVTLKIVKALYEVREHLAIPYFKGNQYLISNDSSSAKMALKQDKTSSQSSIKKYLSTDIKINKKSNKSSCLSLKMRLDQNFEKPKNFQDFLDEIGLPKRTAYRWLSLYLPEENRLLSSLEAKALKEEKHKELIELYEDNSNEFGSSWRPDGWNASTEKFYRNKLIQKGIDDVDLRIMDSKPLSNDFFQSLEDKAHIQVSAAEIMEFSAAIEFYKPYLSNTLEDRAQIKMITIIQKYLDVLDIKTAKAAAISLCQMINAYMHKKEMENER